MVLTPGTRLGSYEVIAKLGEGGMGEVYRARDRRLDRDVALKILSPAFASDPDRLMRFEREAKTLATLNHPHIAHIHGIEDSSGTRALVMELVEGETLADRIARGPILLDEALPIARQIAEALEAAHDAGIVHRDLKPANIKVRPDGTVKVLDFGLARAFDQDLETSGRQDIAHPPTITSPAMTAQGVILGTAAYMSPEQARGQTVDGRTDLWAFGCVLFEMLTGTRVFAGQTLTDVLAGVVKEEPRWGDLPADTPTPMHRLLRRCLTKDRRKRLASAADVRLDIDEAVETAHTGAALRTTRERSPLTLGFGLAAAIAAAAGAYALGARAAAVPSTPAPVARFVIPAPAGTQIVTGHREVAVSPDGQQIAFIARGADGQHIYLRRVDTLTPQQVPGTDSARDPAFSPDGRWLAFHAGNKIHKVRLDGSLPAVLADAVHSHGLAWHPTEDAIYFAPHELSPLWKVPANGGAPPVQVTTLDAARGERSHEWPVFADAGRTLLFSVNSNTAGLDEEEVSVLPLSTNVRTTVRTGGSAFGFTDRRELLFVRRRSVVGARYDDGRLSSPELLDPAAADGRAAVSSNGTFAYVPAADQKRRTLVWISPAGQMSDAGFGQRGFDAVALSPDGRRAAIAIADDRDSALYVADARGGPLTALTRPATFTPTWSPDGKWIAGTVWQADTNRSALARVVAEPGRNWEALATGGVEDVISQWAPDGRGLLFSRRDSTTGRRSPMRLALDHTPPTASLIVDAVGDHIVQSPALSPDGRWLAYESNETGRLEVYVQSHPSPTARVQISRDGGAWPTWTRRGDAVYFINGSAIMSSAITTQPELQGAAPRIIVNDSLFVRVAAGARPFDVTPGGHILAIKEDGSIRSDHIVVVQNWLKEVRARNAQGGK
jgi:eukaryotic-like serine/threonine-protein kinase